MKRPALLFFFIASLFTTKEALALNDSHSLQGWNSRELALNYYHHSDVQLQWAWQLFAKVGALRGDEKALDYGAGDGKITSLLSYMLSRGSITGIDVSTDMVTLAKELYEGPGRPNLKFELLHKGSFEAESHVAKYDLIFSFCVLHLVREPGELFAKMQRLLRPVGRLAATWPSGRNAAFARAIDETLKAQNVKLPAPSKEQISIRDVEYVKGALEKSGFQVQHAEAVQTHNGFASREELLTWFIGTLSANWDIPSQKRVAFFEDLTTRYLFYTEQPKQGAVYFDLERIDVIATKK